MLQTFKTHKMIKKILCSSCLICIFLFGKAQLRLTSTSGFSAALNGTTNAAATQQALTSFSSGAIIGNGGLRNTGDVVYNPTQNVLINYSVPDRVMLDRLLLSFGISQRITELVNDQISWQNANIDAFYKQSIINSIQQQIDNLQAIWDALSTTCAPVSFKDYRAAVNADVRYNPPIGGSIGLLREDTSKVNFANIAYSSLEANPVRTTVLIYKK